MGVYIKGMAMPKDGELLCVNIYPDGKVCINFDLECKRIATAVPVPPHGRLIDADSFMHAVSLMMDLDGDPAIIIQDIVEGEPTVIEASDEVE